MRIFQSFCARKSAISFDYFCRFCGVGHAFSVMKKKESRRCLNSPSPYILYVFLCSPHYDQRLDNDSKKRVKILVSC